MSKSRGEYVNNTGLLYVGVWYLTGRKGCRWRVFVNKVLGKYLYLTEEK
jgi:hypothetical protein